MTSTITGGDGRVYSEIPVREGVTLRLSTSTWHGGTKVHVREWWSPGPGKGPFPTGRGVAFGPEEARRLQAGLALLVADMDEAGG